MFSFDNAKSPNPLGNMGSPFKRFPGEYHIDMPSPFRTDVFFKNTGYSPAFNFNDSSYRRNGNNNYFFNPSLMMNQDSVGKMRENNIFFAMNNPNNQGKKF